MSPGDSPNVDIEVVRLPAGDSWRTDGDEQREQVLVVLTGLCAVTAGGDSPKVALGGRTEVFDGPASAVYLSVGSGATVEAISDVSLALIHAAVDGEDQAAPRADALESYVVRPGDVHQETRGKGEWRREVHDIIGPEQPARRLLVGETFSAGGAWSSYPPHRHDRDDPPYELRLSEAFLIKVRPADGFAVMIAYPEIDSGERSHVLHDDQVVRVGEGYHSFVVAGGHDLYYLWALASPKRQLSFRTDSRHEWLLD